MTEALLDDAGEAIRLVWFNQPYLEKTLKRIAAAGQSIVAYGQARRSGWSVEIQTPGMGGAGREGDPLSANRIVPVYPRPKEFGQSRIRRLVDSALRDCTIAHRRDAARRHLRTHRASRRGGGGAKHPLSRQPRRCWTRRAAA